MDEMKYDTSKPDGAMKKVMDNTRMKKILRWEPETSLREGIGKTYEWYLNDHLKER